VKVSVIALRNVFRNRRRSILSVTAVGVAAMSITLLFSVLEGLKHDIRVNSWNYETGQIRIRHQDFDRYEYLNPVQYVVEDADSLVEVLRNRPDISAVSPRITVPAAAFRGERQIFARGLGLDLAWEGEYQDLESTVVRGRLPEPKTQEAVLGVRLAQELEVEIGGHVTFLTQTRTRRSNAFTVDVVGLVSFPVAQMDKAVFILPLEAAGHFMRMGGAVSEIHLKTGEKDGSVGIARKVNRYLESSGPHGARATSWTEVSAGYDYLQMAQVVYAIMALFFFLLGSTVVINTTMMTVHERTREIGTLSAMGMHGGELVRLFFTEAAYLAVTGSFCGVMTGIAIALPLGRFGINMGAAMEMVDMSISSVLYPVVNWHSTVVVFLYSVAVALAASFFPARRASRLRPVEALRSA
jgi:putative ABC transport system permease protein